MTKQDATKSAGRKQGRRPRFARYVRVSDVGDRGDKLRSPAYQSELIERFAAHEGVELVAYPDELDVSGNSRTRVVLDRILEAIAAGELDGIIVAKLDRLSRLRPKDRVELFELIEETHGARVLSATESNDVSTPEGRFVRELFLGLARMQYEQLAEGFEKAKSAAIAAGVSTAKVAAFGTRFDAEHRVVAGPRSERELLELMLERRLAGASYGELLAIFEERTGRKSSRATVASMLANDVYVGVLRNGDRVNESAHDPIVDVELFQAVQAQSELSKIAWAKGRRETGRARDMASGIARCEGCGAAIVSTEAGGVGKRYYRCSQDAKHCQARASISVEALDRFIEEQLLAWAGPVADEPVELELEVAVDRDGAERRLELAEARLRAWSADVELEEADEESYRTGLEARQALVAKRRRELEELGEATELELARTTLRQEWPTLDSSERRRLLRVAIGELVVRKTPYFNAPAGERVRLSFAGERPVGVSDPPPPLSAPARAKDGAELV